MKVNVGELSLLGIQKLSEKTYMVNVYQGDKLYGILIVNDCNIDFYKDIKNDKYFKKEIEMIKKFIGSKLGIVNAETYFNAEISYTVTKRDEYGNIISEEKKNAETQI